MVIDRRLLAVVAAMVVPAAVGCSRGERLWPAAGSVGFPTGAPVKGGVIELHPIDGVGRPCRSGIDATGQFDLPTAGRPGAHAGRYRVIVIPPLVIGHAPHGPAVAPRHGSFDTSGIDLEVPEGGDSALRVTVEAKP